MRSANGTTRPLRVTQILYSGLSGVADVAFNLVDGDSERRFHHHMLFVGVVPLVGAYAEGCRRRGVDFDAIRSPPKKPWRAWPQIIRALKAAAADVVIVHGGGPSLIPALLHRLRSRALILVVEHHPIPLRSRVDWSVSRIALRTADKMILLSEQYREEMEKHLGHSLRTDRICIIPNGVDTDDFAPGDRERLKAGPVRLGMAGRFTPSKRFDVGIAMIEELCRREPSTDWRLSLAGGGDDLGRLRRLAAASPCADRIEFPGMLPRKALPDWYRSLSVYFHATEGETMSMAILQAMASGLPIVASDATGVNDLLGPSGAGRLVSALTGTAFAEAVIALRANPGGEEALARSARQLCLQHYGQTAMFRGYAAIIDELLAKRRLRA